MKLLQYLKATFVLIKNFTIVFFVNFIYLFLGLTIALSYIIFPLWPRVSRDLWESMTHYQILITLVKIVVLLVQIIYFARLLNFISTKEPTGLLKKIKDFFHKINEARLEALKNFYDFFAYVWYKLIEKIFKNRSFNYLLSKKICDVIINMEPNKCILFLLSLKIIPKIIFLMAFSYDVILCKHLHYTFLCLPLFLLGFIEEFLIFLMQDFVNRYFPTIKSFIIITKFEDSEGNLQDYSYEYRPEYQKDPPKLFKNLRDLVENHYNLMECILLFIEYYKLYKSKAFYYYLIQLIIYVIRIILVSYILIYGIT